MAGPNAPRTEQQPLPGPKKRRRTEYKKRPSTTGGVTPLSGPGLADRLGMARQNYNRGPGGSVASKANGAGTVTAAEMPAAPKPNKVVYRANPNKGGTPSTKTAPKAAPPKPTQPAQSTRVSAGEASNTKEIGKSNARAILDQMAAAKTAKKGGTGRYYQGTPLKITAPRGNSTAERERARQHGRQGERDRRK